MRKMSLYFALIFSVSASAQDAVERIRVNQIGYYPNGNFKQTYCVFQDITKQKKIEEKLGETEKNYRTIFNSVNEAIFIHDAATGEIIDVNDPMLKMYGYNNKEELLTNPDNFITADSEYSKEKALENIRKAILEGPQTFEWLTKKKNGEKFWVEVSLRQAEIGGKERVLAVIRDITDRLKAEIALKEKNVFIQTVLDNLPLGIALNTIDEGTAFYWNKKFEEIYGWPADDLKDIKNFFLKVYPDENYRNEIIAKIMSDIQTGDPSRMHWEDCIVTHRDGSVHHVNAVNIPLYEQNTMVSTVMDITAMKKAEIELLKAKEKAEESDRLKTAFLQNISHEIRTPMNAIIGFSDFLNNPGLTPEKRRHYTDIINQSSKQLLSIITDIISIAAIETGQVKIYEMEIKLNETIKLIYAQFVEKARKNKISLRFETSLDDNDDVIKTDKTKLEGILSNFIGNALKFTKKGHITFGYSINDPFIEFYVEDTGIGIPEEMHKEIFKRFRQVETSETRQYGGSGLGLSISKAYVELLGGKIRVVSKPGKGSTFYFTIPYHKATREVQTILPPYELKLNVKSTKTILVAEDEDSNFMLLEELLADPKINLIRAVNGEDAVEICKTNVTIDLVLMDIKMPKMDGLEAARLIKKLNPNLIIVAQTAYSMPGEKDLALKAGCDAFVTKPINANELIRLLETKLMG